MDFLAPSYQTLLQIRHSLERGISLHETICHASRGEKNEFTRLLVRWWTAKERGAVPIIGDIFSPPLQRFFIETLERGLAGEPILSRLSELEEEMRLAMVDTIERHLQRLPVILLLPLTGLVFPSFMLLILGPLLSQLMRSLQ